MNSETIQCNKIRGNLTHHTDHNIPHPNHTTPHQPQHTTSQPHHTTPTTTYHISRQHTTPHHITPNHTTKHHITPNHITPHHIPATPHHTTPHHTTPQPGTFRVARRGDEARTAFMTSKVLLETPEANSFLLTTLTTHVQVPPWPALMSSMRTGIKV